jgi:hypothetical protein
VFSHGKVVGEMRYIQYIWGRRVYIQDQEMFG